MADIFEIGGNEVAFSKLLEAYIQSGNLNFLIGSGASLPAIRTAGNIEAEINELLDAGNDTEADKKCLEFIEAIGGVHSSITANPPVDPIVETIAGYSEFVAIVDRILFARKNLLLPRQANVFTTNYDMFVEHASSLLPGLMLNDGFDRTSGIANDFPFAPERYFDRTYRSGAVYGHQIEMPTINLVKLHGSLSWRRRSDTIVFDPIAVPKLTAADRADSAKVREYLEKHFLILPNFRKFHSTLMDRVYYDLLRLYANALERGNVVLMCFGFSFADEHILDITRRALRNPTAQLLIFSFDKASSTAYQAKFAKHRNVTVISPEAGALINFATLNKLLNSVLPEVGRSHGA
ncbi:SIR2 family protein [Labrys sp. 22185]|uniref:SIR2 family protein n=1 Tax=Labrys sp. 22185 TaxID=3453888 RepID=UPI003F847F07